MASGSGGGRGWVGRGSRSFFQDDGGLHYGGGVDISHAVLRERLPFDDACSMRLRWCRQSAYSYLQHAIIQCTLKSMT